MSEIVSATFADESVATRVVQELMIAGIPLSEVSVLHSTAAPGREFDLKENRKVAEGAAIGGVTGGAIGGALLGIAGLATVSIPPLGLFAAGPLFAALAGAGGGGAIGTLVGGLIGAGVPEHEALIAETTVKNGGALVAVRAHPEQVKIAKKIFDSFAHHTVPQSK